MAKTHFYLRAGDDPAKILLNFRYKNHRIVLSTGISVPLKFWDKTRERARSDRRFPHASSINAMLSRLDSVTTTLWHEYRTAGIVPAPAKFKAELKARIEDRQDLQKTLAEYIEAFIENREASGTSKGTAQVYRNLQNKLKEYEKARRTTVDFDTITEMWKNEFVAFLFSQKNRYGEPLTDNYVSKLLSVLRVILRQAFKDRVTKENRAASVKLSLKEREVQDVYLTEAEIVRLFNLEGLGERLERTRDWLLIGCLTGLRFSDFTRIKPENIEHVEHGGQTIKCLVSYNQKTGNKTTLPLTNPMLQTILARYDDRPPKPISDQKLNAYMKELCELAGLDTLTEITDYRAKKPITKTFKKYELVSTHTGRRSFATNAYKLGMPIPQIMEFTGHEKVESFLKYIKVSGDETAVMLADHRFFTGPSTLRKAEEEPARQTDAKLIPG